MDNQRDKDVIEIDVLELWQVLREKCWLILSVSVFAAMICFGISKFILLPSYESTTKIYILNKTDATSVTYNDVQIGTQLTKDYAQLINSRYVLEEVIRELSLDLDYDQMLDKVSVDTPADTRIVSITVKDHEPVMAMEIANSIREAASAHIQNVMDIEAVNIVETANMPIEKAGPNCILWTLFGGVLSLLAISMILVVRYLLDDSIKSSEDIEKHLGLSTLALIPLLTEDNDNDRKKTRKKRK